MAIKPSLRQEFSAYLVKNPSIVDSLTKAVEGLDGNKTPMQVEDSLHAFTLTAEQVGLIAAALVKFHDRGDEFKAYWTKRNNVVATTNLDQISVGFSITKRIEK